jgi:hypothetical protein
VPSTAAARESFRGVLREVRKQNFLADQSLETVISFLSLSHRLDVIADDLEICRSQAWPLQSSAIGGIIACERASLDCSVGVLRPTQVLDAS